MKLSSAERLKLRELLLGSHGDWASVRAALKAKNLTLSQSSMDRFFSGELASERTFRTIALLLGTTAEALRGQLRILVAAKVATARRRSASPLRLRNADAFQVAFQLWVEMTTRKIGLTVDPGQDIVTEVYDSWYAFFRTARELIKAIPLHRNPRSPELRHLVQLSQAVLNDGLRPHLQRWQARFRHWAKNGAAQDPAVSPQQAQQRFPEWKQLRDDLIATNRRLNSYVTALESALGSPSTPPEPAGATRRRRTPAAVPVG